MQINIFRLLWSLKRLVSSSTAIYIMIAAQSLWAQSAVNTNSTINALFNSIPGCQAKEFLDLGYALSMGHESISIEDLQAVDKEVVRPLRFNKRYREWYSRPVFRKNIRAMLELFKTQNINSISYNVLVSEASARYNGAKERKEIGECFNIDTFGGTSMILGERRDLVEISPDAMNEIDNLFLNTVRPQSTPLSKREKQIVGSGSLSLGEISELRAIRKAYQIFEKSTFMVKKKSGGFISNIQGEFLGNFRQNCALQASTYLQFLNQLRVRGDLKYFQAFKFATNQPNLWKDPSNGGHEAVETIAHSGQIIVIDSWFEKGGVPPHILWLDDWKRLSLWQANKFADLVETPL